MISEEMNAFFDERYVIVPESGCWIWTGEQKKDGYGRMRVKGCDDRNKRVFAHRYSYSRFVGEIPDGLCVCHKCDTPSCVNPAHLWVGTHAENMNDRNKEGRASGGTLSGEKCPSSKLSERDIVSIFHHRGTIRQISEEFGIAKSHVSRIRGRQTWRHVTQNLAKANSAPGGSRHSIAQNRQSDKGKTQ